MCELDFVNILARVYDSSDKAMHDQLTFLLKMLSAHLQELCKDKVFTQVQFFTLISIFFLGVVNCFPVVTLIK